MVDLINDGALIGIWPLHEPSGTPTWKNYSPARAGMPSGLSFDFHVHNVGQTAIPDDDDAQAVWPGQEIIFNQESGVTYRGLKLQGQANLLGTAVASAFNKMPVLGLGWTDTRRQTLSVPVAQSGITVGLWVYPRSNGWLNAVNEGGFSLVSDAWFTGYGRTHAVIGQDHTDNGWYMGVSGDITQGAQFNTSKFGGPPQLRAYLLANVAAGVPTALDTPLESGRFTHLTMTFRYIDGTNNQIALWKDGHLEASGTTAQEFVLGTAAQNVPLALGPATDGTSATDGYEYTGGWGHLVSGVYCFRRVLNDGEILEMHERGGLQPNLNLRNNTKEVLLSDSNLIAYLPFMSRGLVDISPNSYGFFTDVDEGDRGDGGYTYYDGPFGCGGAHQDQGVSAFEAIVAPSGATFALAQAAGGFTVCGWIAPNGTANDRDGNMLMSIGAVSSATTGAAAATSTNNKCFLLTYADVAANGGDNLRLEIFPIGDDAADIKVITASGERLTTSIMSHYAIVYDKGSRGIALYTNGSMQGSGTLQHDLQDQMVRVAGSGYPFMFLNGVQDGITDAASHGMLGNGGENSAISALALFSRPLLEYELNFLAQSGIRFDHLWRTRHDPRLMGYWPCDDFKLDDIVVEDKARALANTSAHLARGDSFAKWERTYDQDNNQTAGSVYRNNGTSFINLFGIRTLPPELASYGNLGISSGVFSHYGGSFGGGFLTNNSASRNLVTNFISRFKPWFEERDLSPQTPYEYILSYEVTPSGNIPAIDATRHVTAAEQQWHNSLLHVYGNQSIDAGDGEFRSFLTTVNASSGVTICFTGKDGGVIAPLLSGVLSYGVPTRVLFHAKFESPYNVTDITAGEARLTMTLWISGVPVNRSTRSCNSALIWSDQLPAGTSADWFLQFGGYAATDAYTTAIDVDSGLGDIYLREIFSMQGRFYDGEIAALAASGIQTPVIAGRLDEKPKTQVTLADSNLQGYWRFHGFEGGTGLTTGGGSGTTDLSTNNRHLDPLAQRYFELTGDTDMAAFMRFMPGPLINSDLGIQCSGVHMASVGVANTVPNMIAPFAVSGSVFDNPATNGFSIGFLFAKREDVTTSTADVIMAYGTLTSSVPNGTVIDTVQSANRGWAILMDDTENLKMIVSTGGFMYLDGAVPGAPGSGQVVCGITNTGNVLDDDRNWNNHKHGDFMVPGADYMSHVMWTYDPTDFGVRCYLNGDLVDEKFVDRSLISPWTGLPQAPQTPQLAEARMITFFSHQADTGNAWDFRQNSMVDEDTVLTDVCYFNSTLTEEEVRYIAFNGIDDATGTVTSGTIGGYVHGQDTASGIVGGYTHGLNTGSGLIGGLLMAGILASGFIGGYVSGVIFGEGTIGGWVQGLDFVSGIIAGYIKGLDVGSGMIAGYVRGQEIGSGVFGGLIMGGTLASGLMGGFIMSSQLVSGLMGGFMLGGLQGRFEIDAGYTVEVIAAEDFDALLEIAKTATSDFDAKIVIFQNELTPLVDIIIPSMEVSGLAPPFNQYFIGTASGRQGKSITQTRWNFGDFTPTVNSSVSGADLYAVQHYFANSGIYAVRFTAIDSDGLRASAIRIVNAASGIDPVHISLSGIPRSGFAELIVDFTTTIDAIPPGVSVVAKLLDFDDGQTTVAFNPTHAYVSPGIMKPVWIIRDSRGVIWSDTLNAGGNN